MAVTLKSIVVNVASNVTSTLYTVPSGKAAMLFGVRVSTETAGGAVGASVSFDELGNGTKTGIIAVKDSMAQYTPYELLGKMPMQAGAKLIAETVDGACTYVVSYAELDA